MYIGITYDLRADYLAQGYSEEETAEFDRPETIEAIETALQSLGHATQRIGSIRKLVAALAAGTRWDLVFNIAEGMHGYGREAQVPALLEAYEIPCTLSDSLTLALALHKGMTKSVVRDQGIPTPDFAVVADQGDVDDVRLPYPLFVKPIAEGTGKGITGKSRIANASDLRLRCEELLATCGQPLLVETFLPGREFTVGILGTARRARAVGVIEVVLLDNAESDAYSYVNKEKCEELVEYRLVDDALAHQAAEVSVRAWRALGCRDAGRIDVRADDQGIINFIEVNPLAGLHPHHSDLPIICGKVGMPYIELIREIVDEASRRVKARPS